MRTTVKLTNQASANLARLAQEYKLTESGVLNILLTVPADDPYLANRTAAAEVIDTHYTNIAIEKAIKEAGYEQA